MRSLIALAVTIPALALAQVPEKVGYQGRLLKADGTPEGGIVKMTFSIYAAATGGMASWSEDQSVAMTDGFYATFLGDVKPFTGALFDGTEKYLEIATGGVALTPRQRIGSVPYAIAAHHLVGGKVDAASISVNGKAVIDNNGKLVGTAAYSAATGSGLVISPKNALSLLDICKKDEVLKFDGAEWKCGVAGATYTAGAGSGLSIGATNAVSLLSTCAKDQVLKYDGATWACAADTDTTYKAGPGVHIDASNTVGLSNACIKDQVLKHNGTTWACSADKDTNTLYGAGPGITIDAANVISLPTTCTSSQLLKWNGSKWECKADSDSAVLYSAGSGIAIGGANNAISLIGTCISGQLLRWDGSKWVCSNDTGTVYRAGPGVFIGSNNAIGLAVCSSGQILKSNGTDWGCASDANTVYTAGSGSGLAIAANNSVSLVETCTAGQVLKWNGTGWACASDLNSGGTVTDVTASAPLFSSGGLTPNLTIAQANASTNGYLASTDWTTFNNKVSTIDSRLSDDRNPKPGSSHYVQNGTAAQAASFNISGTASIAGTVGIGTAAPTEKLEVVGGAKGNFFTDRRKYSLTAAPKWIRIAQGSANLAGTFEVRWESSGNHGHIRLAASANYATASGIAITVLDTSTHNLPRGIDKIRFLAGGTYVPMYLEVYPNQLSNSNGPVAIDVYLWSGYGWSLIDVVDGSVPAGYTAYTSEATGAFQVGKQTSESFFVGSRGDVGLGTTSPLNRLHLYSGSSAQALALYSDGYNATDQWGTRIFKKDCFDGPCNGVPLVVQTQSGGTWNTSATFGHGQDVNHPTFKSYGQTYLATGGGNVGIGSTNPSTLLYTNVAGSGSGDVVRIGNATQGTYGTFGFNTAAPGYSYWGPTTTEQKTKQVVLTGAGNVGIGNVNPAAKLDVSGVATAYWDGSQGNSGNHSFCVGGGYIYTRYQAATQCKNLNMRLCTMAELGAYAEADYASCCWGWTADPGSNNSATSGKAAFFMYSSETTNAIGGGCGGSPGGLRIQDNLANTTKWAAHCCR